MDMNAKNCEWLEANGFGQPLKNNDIWFTDRGEMRNALLTYVKILGTAWSIHVTKRDDKTWYIQMFNGKICTYLADGILCVETEDVEKGMKKVMKEFADILDDMRAASDIDKVFQNIN